jgi:eukaryotic sulfide quinone oxidoreductase
MKPVEELKNSKLADSTGFVDVSKETLQHKKYANVFAIGDCTNLPTSKTAAAVGTQSGILFTNMCNVIEGKSPSIYVSSNFCFDFKKNYNII